MFRRIILLFSSSIFLVISTTTSNAQQSAFGNCDAQLQGNSNQVNITCVIASASSGFPDDSLNSTVEVNLQSSASNLQPGSQHFTLMLRNNTPNQTVTFPISEIHISDDQGNTYDADVLAMHATSLVKAIPPNRSIRVNYVLSEPISENASQVTFTLDGLWTKQTGNKFESPIPLIQWTTNIY